MNEITLILTYRFELFKELHAVHGTSSDDKEKENAMDRAYYASRAPHLCGRCVVRVSPATKVVIWRQERRAIDDVKHQVRRASKRAA